MSNWETLLWVFLLYFEQSKVSDIWFYHIKEKMDVSMVDAFKNGQLTPKTTQMQGVRLILAHGSIWSKKGQSRKTIHKINITSKKMFTGFTAHSKNYQKTDYSYYFSINVFFPHSVNVGRKRSWTAWDVFSKITQYQQFIHRVDCPTLHVDLQITAKKEPNETTTVFSIIISQFVYT